MRNSLQLIELEEGVSLLISADGQLFGVLSKHDLLEAQDFWERVRLHLDSFRKFRLAAQPRSQVNDRRATLSAREREVCDLLVAAQHTKEIARRLEISAKTVEFHRANILKKMQAESVVELVRMLLAPKE